MTSASLMICHGPVQVPIFSIAFWGFCIIFGANVFVIVDTSTASPRSSLILLFSCLRHLILFTHLFIPHFIYLHQSSGLVSTLLLCQFSE
ncbi:hypothetical protein V8E51_011134 [Hyaloscypha variabilis]